MLKDSKYLLVTRIGRKSLHKSWLATPYIRKFDVVLSAYNPNVNTAEQEGVHFEVRPGYKVAGYSGFIRENRDILRLYDYVCFFDEDLEATTETLNRMFEICAAGSYKIAQPALTANSHYTYAALVQQKAWHLRHVTFIEMMCPIFRIDVLDQIEHLYHSHIETGIDIIWSQQIGSNERDFAVIDATPVRHTEPVGARMDENGFDKDKGYDVEIDNLLRSHSLPWVACVPLSAISHSKKLIRAKPLLFLAALPLLLSVPLQSPYVKRLKLVLIHLKHIAESARGRVPRREVSEFTHASNE